jgi:PKD repeat protein
VLNTILPQLASRGVGPRTLPILLFYNVVMYDTNPRNCCITGYHNALLDNAMHLNTYVVSDYDETGIFGKFLQDIMSMSRDIGEWMDDPTGGNTTPPWENIGQVTGCQRNLDVGDPLSGTVEIPSNTKTVYHVQDLAFRSWFYHDVVSTGVNGWYSLYGNFRGFAASCQSETAAFAAEPNSGAAPLLVNFRASPAVIGTVDFGDGTTGTMEQAATCFGCPTLSVAGHVYQSPGTYTARLVSAGGPLGSQVITVTNR